MPPESSFEPEERRQKREQPSALHLPVFRLARNRFAGRLPLRPMPAILEHLRVSVEHYNHNRDGEYLRFRVPTGVLDYATLARKVNPQDPRKVSGGFSMHDNAVPIRKRNIDNAQILVRPDAHVVNVSVRKMPAAELRDYLSFVFQKDAVSVRPDLVRLMAISALDSAYGQASREPPGEHPLLVKARIRVEAENGGAKITLPESAFSIESLLRRFRPPNQAGSPRHSSWWTKLVDSEPRLKGKGKKLLRFYPLRVTDGFALESRQSGQRMRDNPLPRPLYAEVSKVKGKEYAQVWQVLHEEEPGRTVHQPVALVRREKGKWVLRADLERIEDVLPLLLDARNIEKPYRRVHTSPELV